MSEANWSVSGGKFGASGRGVNKKEPSPYALGGQAGRRRDCFTPDRFCLSAFVLACRIPG